MPEVRFTSVPTKTLTETISSSSTSFKLNNILSWDQETDLTSANFGDIGYMALRSSDNKYIEFAVFDPATIADDEIDFLYRGIALSGENRTTEVAANKRTWIKGDTKVELGADNSLFLQWLKDYVDSVAIAGAPDASTTVKGISKLSTAPALSTNPIAVGDNDTRVPTQGENDALAAGGAFGTPSTSNKYLTETKIADDITTGGSLQTQTTSTDTFNVGEANTTTNQNRLAQKFVATRTMMRGVTLNKKADTGSFTGTVTVTLQADSAGNPSGSALATFVLTNAQWLLLQTGDIDAVFATEYSSLVIGDTYWVVIQTSTADTSNHPNFGGRASGGGTNTFKYNNTTDGWVAFAASDLYYRTLEGNVSQLVQTGTDSLVPSIVSPYSLVEMNNTSTTVGPSLTETTAYTKFLPSDFWKLGSGFRIRLLGSMVFTDAETKTIRIKLNGTAVVTVTRAFSEGSSSSYCVDAYVVNNASLSAQEYAALLSDTIPIVKTFTGTATVDTSIGTVLTVTIQNGDNDASDTITLSSVILEKIG